jgi:alkylation response protein AidB-like acyl-CoA dehydrogenase
MSLYFDFSAEQEMLAASTRGVLARGPKWNGNGAANAEDFGAHLTEHGVLGVMAPEEAGGLALGLTDALAVALETGRAQTPFPVIESIAAAELIGRLQPDDAKSVLLGKALATCATGGEAEISAAPGGGEKLKASLIVPFADRARWLALPVRRNDNNEPGPWATVIDLAGAGVSITPAAGLDLTYPLFCVEVERDIEAGDIAAHDLQAMLTTLAAGELAGAAEHCLDATVKYLKERSQFGKLIGANQALRHRAADDWVAVQGMRAASEYAAAAFDASRAAQNGSALPVDEFRRAAQVAKAFCSEAARRVAEHAVQSHGGIGFTWDFGLHIPMRRILRLATSFGTAADHYDALAAELLARDTNGRNGSSKARRMGA